MSKAVKTKRKTDEKLPERSPAEKRSTPAGRDEQLKDTAGKDEEQNMKKTVMIVYAVLIVLGIGTGYLLSQRVGGSSSSAEGSASKTVTTEDGSEVPKTAGVSDPDTFSDTAEGELAAGGLEGEGTHHVLREGGPSQTIYIISSTIDLDDYVGKKVKIWGQTMAAQKAPWLMDVGKLEVQ